ncbi:hypothetical protein VKT23_010426 [Stygiomarasmius scandens]|uniref:Uncharacterized protein n=1 Tax=Marasmiellus scandens TaxID=2682957 RepID=A0ABR1JBN3_9AGAR
MPTFRTDSHPQAYIICPSLFLLQHFSLPLRRPRLFGCTLSRRRRDASRRFHSRTSTWSSLLTVQTTHTLVAQVAHCNPNSKPKNYNLFATIYGASELFQSLQQLKPVTRSYSSDHLSSVDPSLHSSTHAYNSCGRAFGSYLC